MSDVTVQSIPAPPTPTSWTQFERAELRVRQSYRYEYSSPIHDLTQRLMMLPPQQHGVQRLLQHDLQVQGADDVVTQIESDRFGNSVYQVSSSTVRKAVEFTAEFTVERYAERARLRVPRDPGTFVYLARTALTAASAPIQEAAQAIAVEIDGTPVNELADEVLPDGAGSLDDDGVRQWAAAQCGGVWAARAITYQYGVTGVRTPAAMALHLGRGVCQDFAHLAIAILRELHVPVRYVSGHLLGEGAPHAWIEALLPDPDARGEVCAVPYDPTHHVTPGLNYITVAVGRDYADITPTSGTFRGVSGRFTADKNAWIMELA
ncbi:MAG: transglutaminase family protein [bacterium]